MCFDFIFIYLFFSSCAICFCKLCKLFNHHSQECCSGFSWNAKTKDPPLICIIQCFFLWWRWSKKNIVLFFSRTLKMLWFLIYFRMYIHYIREKISTGLYKGGNLWWRGNPECLSKIKHKTKSVFDFCIDYLHYSWLLVLLCCSIITIDTKKCDDVSL